MTAESKSQPIFTQEEIAQLYAPFPLRAHSIREGYKNKAKTRVRWFVYLDRIAIQRRLDELFPGQWEFSVQEIHRAAKHVNITATLTIRGVSRSFNGGQSDNGNSNDPENLEKGAMTDTFRRCASLWGFGAYINDGVDIYTAGYEENNWSERDKRETEAKRMFQAWYDEQCATPQPPVDEPPRTSKRVPTDHIEPATGNGKRKSEAKSETPADEPAVKYDLQRVIDQTAFMYDHPNHAENSINAMIRVEEIEPEDTNIAAIWKVFEHRAKSDPYKMSMQKVYEALSAAMEADGSAVPVGSIKQWVTEGKTLEQAWQAVNDYHENIDLQPAAPKEAAQAELIPPGTQEGNEVPY
jgi:hypothetical protein